MLQADRCVLKVVDLTPEGCPAFKSGVENNEGQYGCHDNRVDKNDDLFHSLISHKSHGMIVRVQTYESIDIYNPLHYNTQESYCIDLIFRLIASLFRIRLPKSERAAGAGNTYDLRIDLPPRIMYDQSVRYFLPTGTVFCGSTPDGNNTD